MEVNAYLSTYMPFLFPFKSYYPRYFFAENLVKTSNFYDLLNLTMFGSRPKKGRSGASRSCDDKARTEISALLVVSFIFCLQCQSSLVYTQSTIYTPARELHSVHSPRFIPQSVYYSQSIVPVLYFSPCFYTQSVVFVLYLNP